MWTFSVQNILLSNAVCHTVKWTHLTYVLLSLSKLLFKIIFMYWVKFSHFYLLQKIFLIDVHHFKNGRFDTSTGLGMLITVKTTICCNSILCQQRKINLHTALARVSERMSFEQLTIFSNHAYSSHMCSSHRCRAVPFILKVR